MKIVYEPAFLFGEMLIGSRVLQSRIRERTQHKRGGRK